MNKKPINKSKKSNIKCEHCEYWESKPTKKTIWNNAIMMCNNEHSPKYNTPCNYWNRCKMFKWDSNGEYINE